eukprot:TRINITY_DN7533_c0_g1_i2.p1 TRINITY_DN7533_c0_g1~~TRINITY_DN7533_c0_g1_i2.p1  ORF type:complete len:207 (-),score=33.81 TRINITY_DN7533_c0_g1_i2:103-723(-)
MNEKLRDRTRDIATFYPYIKLVSSGLSMLPRVEETVYRGMKGDLKHLFKKGEFVMWWGFTSCTLHVEPILEFIGQEAERVLLCVKQRSGAQINAFSQFPREEEVLLPPGRYLKVESVLPQGTLFIVNLVESLYGAEGTGAYWEWEHKNKWDAFDPMSSSKIEEAFQSKLPSLSIDINSNNYIINLQTLEQTNTQTNFTRKIRRIVK